jgi:hypothetical protein
MFGSNKRAGLPEIRVVFIKPVEPYIKTLRKQPIRKETPYKHAGGASDGDVNHIKNNLLH